MRSHAAHIVINHIYIFPNLIVAIFNFLIYLRQYINDFLFLLINFKSCLVDLIFKSIKYFFHFSLFSRTYLNLSSLRLFRLDMGCCRHRVSDFLFRFESIFVPRFFLMKSFLDQKFLWVFSCALSLK